MKTGRHYLMGYFAILVCFALGNLIVDALSLPLPPALVGLLILLCMLLIRNRPSESLSAASQPLLKHMSLLFVPAVLGVGVYWNDIQTLSIPLFLSIGVSTVVSLAITAIFAQRLLKGK